jgi:hypothetical protein
MPSTWHYKPAIAILIFSNASSANHGYSPRGKFQHSAACSIGGSVSFDDFEIIGTCQHPGTICTRIQTMSRGRWLQGQASTLAGPVPGEKRNDKQDRDGGTGITLCRAPPPPPPRAGQDSVGQPKIAHAAARLHLQYIPPSYAAMHLSLARLDKHQPVTTGSRDSEK